MGLLEIALDPATVVVAVDPGKVMNRVWVSNGAGLLEEPVSLPVARSGYLIGFDVKSVQPMLVLFGIR